MSDWNRSASETETRPIVTLALLAAGLLAVPVIHVLATAAVWVALLVLKDLHVVGIDTSRIGWALFLFGIGLTQLPYMVPLIGIMLWKQRTIAAGLILGACLTFLLNGACWALLILPGFMVY